MNENERRVHDALRTLLDPVAPREDLPAATLARARRRSRFAAAAVAVAVVVVATAVAWAAVRPGTREELPRPAAETGPHLFLSGKYGDVWRVGVDGDVVHAKVPELDPGDPPHHLLRRGRSLVAWGYETYLLDRELESPPKLLVEDSLFFIPSVHEDRVWVTTEDDDPDTEGLVATVREVSVDGTVTVPDVRPPHGGWPEASLHSGLLFWRAGERYVWDPETDDVVFRFRSEDLGPTHRDLVVWCEFGCTTLHLTDVATGEETTIAPPDSFRGFRAWDGRFAPDGKTIAVPVVPDASGDRVHLALVDVDAAAASVVPGTETGGFFNFVEWSASGSHVFFTGGGAEEEREIFVYDTEEGAARELEVSVGDFYDAAAI